MKQIAPAAPSGNEHAGYEAKCRELEAQLAAQHKAYPYGFVRKAGVHKDPTAGWKPVPKSRSAQRTLFRSLRPTSVAPVRRESARAPRRARAAASKPAVRVDSDDDPPAPPPIDLAELARLVAPLVLEALTRAAPEPPAYSTRSGEEPPEFRGRARRRQWCRTAPTIPGALADGKRWTVVPRAAYEAWRTGQAPASAPVAPSTWDPDSVVRLLGRVPGARKAGAR